MTSLMCEGFEMQQRSGCGTTEAAYYSVLHAERGRITYYPSIYNLFALVTLHKYDFNSVDFTAPLTETHYLGF